MAPKMAIEGGKNERNIPITMAPTAGSLGNKPTTETNVAA